MAHEKEGRKKAHLIVRGRKEEVGRLEARWRWRS
jgi:hypothetical protein